MSAIKQSQTAAMALPSPAIKKAGLVKTCFGPVRPILTHGGRGSQATAKIAWAGSASEAPIFKLLKTKCFGIESNYMEIMDF